MKDFITRIKKLKRGPQVILPKDIGIIITETGIGKNSKILEAGTGSGMLTSYLANISKKVITYEKRENFYELAKKNFTKLGFKNIKLVNKNISEANEKNIDVFILDLPNPHDYLDIAEKSLNKMGFLVCYLPSITQVQDLINNLNNLRLTKVTEIIRRNWLFENQRIRPKSKIIGHTGFLVFLKKI